MNIKITGASGYLGTIISKELTQQGYNVSGIQRKLIYGSISVFSKEIEGADVIINLAGAPILQRWTERTKRLIYESRVRTTKNIVKAINELPKEKRPKKFITASAIGIYKSGEIHDEESTNFDTGFAGNVVKEWENATSDLPDDIQKITFRIGLVLGKEAKSIKNLILPFKLGLGATIGNGEQAFPFIHEKDVAGAISWAINDLKSSEIFNLVSPENIDNKQFTKSLAKQFNSPAFLFIPSFMIKLALGEASVLLTESPQVNPKKLLEAGYEFKYPAIDKALGEIIA